MDFKSKMFFKSMDGSLDSNDSHSIIKKNFDLSSKNAKKKLFARLPAETEIIFQIISSANVLRMRVPYS